MDDKKERPRTEDELREQLAMQIDFLTRSAEAFDRGFTDEAIRLAATLRLLLHDTSNSKSLLGQLKMKDRLFLDTSCVYDPENIAPFWGLISIALGPPEVRYVAMLDNVKNKIRKAPFSEWWNEIVFADAYKRTLTRKDLVLTAANQDGGVHVDASLNETYAAFTKDNALGWKAGTTEGERPIAKPEYPAIRQIAHEVLKTIVPGYTQKPKIGVAQIIGNVSLKPVGPAADKNLLGRKIGRNQPCLCGSGKKFKKCCGR